MIMRKPQKAFSTCFECITMADTQLTLDGAELLMEAARVFNAAGGDYRGAAAALAEAAWQKSQIAATDPAIRDAIAGDVAALRLSGRLPGGYRKALEILDTRINDAAQAATTATTTSSTDKNDAGLQDQAKKNEIAAEDTQLRLYLLRALSRGQEYRDRANRGETKGSADMRTLRNEILADLKIVFGKRPEWAALNERFWKPTKLDPAKEDDLVAAYSDAANDMPSYDDLATYLNTQVPTGLL